MIKGTRLTPLQNSVFLLTFVLPYLHLVLLIIITIVSKRGHTHNLAFPNANTLLLIISGLLFLSSGFFLSSGRGISDFVKISDSC